MKDRRDVKMKIIRTKDYQDMSRKAANIISAQMILKDDSVLGLATGSTPIGIYDQLVDWYKKGDLDFSRSPFHVGRSDRIRTCDPCVPNAVLYQAELHSDGCRAT